MWTPEEKNAVSDFHTEEMKDKIRHYPSPLTRSRRPLNVRTMQYRKAEDGWIVDTRAHPDIHSKHVATDEDFAEAMKKQRTRTVPRHEAKKVVGDGEYDGASWASYETAGRIVPDKSGRHATLEARFEGHER